MFDQQGTVKIIDFGSVKIAEITEITPLTEGHEENVLGTRNYTAPEYYSGQSASIKSDLFSLATILYEMLNGTLPYGQDLPEKPDNQLWNNLRYIQSITG